MHRDFPRLGRTQLCNLLARRLRGRWLRDAEHVFAILNHCFGPEDRALQTPAIREISSELSAEFAWTSNAHAGETELSRLLDNLPSVRALFAGRKRIAISKRSLQRLQASVKLHDVPQLRSDEDVCQLLGITSYRELDWLTLPHNRRATHVQHYRRVALRKKSGGTRWLEEPLPRLKEVQRSLNSKLLSRIPVHEAAHAFRRARSRVTCASVHSGQRVVLKMDLENFFGSISLRRVTALLRTMGYAQGIALRLAQLCVVPGEVANESVELRTSRLPQGAPTSPALANAVLFQLDRRLAGLARQATANYTRYADDLIFSGGHRFASCTPRFATSVAAVVIDEGFRVQFRKTRRLLSGVQQNVLGLTVNERPNATRQEYECLKAILHNCTRHGPASQNTIGHPNFYAHLQGRIAAVAATNAIRGHRLLEKFNTIDWPDASSV